MNTQERFDMVNGLTIEDVEFILLVWKDRISVWNSEKREQFDVVDVWRNGTVVELGVL